MTKEDAIRSLLTLQNALVQVRKIEELTEYERFRVNALIDDIPETIRRIENFL